MLEMNSIPIVLCPMALQMDQIEFGKRLGIYNVTGFFKATPLLQMHGTCMCLSIVIFQDNISAQ